LIDCGKYKNKEINIYNAFMKIYNVNQHDMNDGATYFSILYGGRLIEFNTPG